ncbi:MAG: ABC transporter permease [Alphaproteobacteria bacterium]|nr:ABC transporter permease [Alphaproteobacteria bacterium]
MDLRAAVRSFRGSVTAMLGVGITAAVLIAALLGPLAMPYSVEEMDFTSILQAPSLAHPFGTDSFGRDVLARVLTGSRISLMVSVTAIGAALALGAIAGMTAAYAGGWADAALMRLADLLFAFPSFVLALFLVIVLGFGIGNLIGAIALVYFPIFARLARNTTLLVREEPYVQAARLMGQPPLAIMLKEILPNISAPLMVQATIGIAFGIIIEAGLSFIGLGVQPPTPSLGTIMADGRDYFSRGPWVLTLTGLWISVALLGLNLCGDALRDALDPRLRQRVQA